jgi:adenylyl-sulfate kinase
VSTPIWHQPLVSRSERWEAYSLSGATFWLTGLSGSGKSTLANLASRALFDKGIQNYVLDADNLRHGLNKDLKFSDSDRRENIRRLGETAALFADAGLVVFVASISPFEASRQLVREIHKNNNLPFFEIYVATSLKECASRDPKGLYAASTQGTLKGLTGVDSTFEPPQNPDLLLDSDTKEASAEALTEFCLAKLSNIP